MTKKLFILVTFIMLALTSAHAQREVYYRCTGNNVNVRKGPGTKYGKVMSVGGAKCPMGDLGVIGFSPFRKVLSPQRMADGHADGNRAAVVQKGCPKGRY